MQESTKTLEPNISADDLIQQDLNKKATRRERIAMLLPYVGIVFLIVFFILTTKGGFIKPSNITLLLNQCFTMVIIMVGAVFLYSMGSLDMAIGSVMSLSALVISLLYINGVPLLLSLLGGIIASALFMSITATAKSYLHVDPFIASLCVMNIGAGIVSATAKVERIVFPYSRALWLDSTYTKVIVLVLVIAAGFTLFKYTSFSKSLKAIGGNPAVARASGIKVERVTLLAYIVTGVAIGIASLFAVVRGGIADTSIGSGMNLNVMIAIVLGGFPLSGGSHARFSAPIVGALMVTILINGLALMGYANATGYAVRGILFIVVVAMTYEKSKGKLIS